MREGNTECIPVLGCLQAQARLSNASAAATFFVVDKGTALLGMDLISALKHQINGDKVCTSIMATNTTPMDDTEIGCVKNFVHKVKIDPSVCASEKSTIQCVHQCVHFCASEIATFTLCSPSFCFSWFRPSAESWCERTGGCFGMGISHRCYREENWWDSDVCWSTGS